MNLYLISQDINTGYDTYSDAVVAARTEDEARMISPDEDGGEPQKHSYAWVSIYQIDQIKIKFIGVADESIEAGIILSPFHAG